MAARVMRPCECTRTRLHPCRPRRAAGRAVRHWDSYAGSGFMCEGRGFGREGRLGSELGRLGYTDSDVGPEVRPTCSLRQNCRPAGDGGSSSRFPVSRHRKVPPEQGLRRRRRRRRRRHQRGRLTAGAGPAAGSRRRQRVAQASHRRGRLRRPLAFCGASGGHMAPRRRRRRARRPRAIALPPSATVHRAQRVGQLSTDTHKGRPVAAASGTAPPEPAPDLRQRLLRRRGARRQECTRGRF